MTTTLETALDKSGQPVKRGTMAHDHHVYMLLTESAANRRDAAALTRYAPRLAELAGRDDHRLYLGIAQRAMAVGERLAGNLETAGEQLALALEAFTDLNARWQMGRTECELAEVRLAGGDRDAARQHLTAALADFEALRAEPDAQRTRAALEAI